MSRQADLFLSSVGEAVGVGESESSNQGIRGNSRLTAVTGFVLLLLLAAEGITVPFTGPLRQPHVFIGLMLVPLFALKVASTSWKIVRYYSGDPEYVREGAPPIWRRLLGPLVIGSTLSVLATGTGLILLHPRLEWLGTAHLASFLVWFPLMTLHVLAHALRTARRLGFERAALGHRSGGAWVRAGSVVVSVVVGIPLGFLALQWLSHYGHHR
jgi:hypothetical protein